MKKFLFLLVLVFLCNCLFAQDTVKIRKYKNSIYLELGVSNQGISIIYDKIIFKKNSIALSINSGITKTDSEAPMFSYPPISINLLIGKKRHHFILGNNLLVRNSYYGRGYNWYYNVYWGYRFHPLKKGFFLKIDFPTNILHYYKDKNDYNSSYFEYFDYPYGLHIFDYNFGLDISIGYSF